MNMIKIVNTSIFLGIIFMMSSCSLENEEKIARVIMRIMMRMVMKLLKVKLFILLVTPITKIMRTSCYWVNGERIELPGGYTATDIVAAHECLYLWYGRGR